ELRSHHDAKYINNAFHGGGILRLGDKGVKKMIAAQADEENEAGEVVRRFYVGHNAVLEADGLLAVIGGSFQVDIFYFIKRDVQHVDLFEIVASLFFEIGLCGRMGICFWRFRHGINIEMSVRVFDDVEFGEIEAQQGQVDFLFR